MDVTGESWSRSQIMQKYSIIKVYQQLHHDAVVFNDDDNDENNTLLLHYIVNHFLYISLF